MDLPQIRFGKHACRVLHREETVLHALLRSGASVSHACKAGACGACLLRAVEGAVPSAAQHGLKDAWKAQGYLLACQCKPDSDLVLDLPGDDARTAARIASIEWLSADVLRMRLACTTPLKFRAGQYVTLRRGDGLARSYSIANLPSDGDWIEHHVRVLPSGVMSNWLASGAAPGDTIDVMGPAGDCFYVPGRADQDLVLAGTGTGLAPLYGIVRDAIDSGHRGRIHLFHGAVRPSGLYLTTELAQLAEEHPNFTYTPTVLEDAGSGMIAGSLDAVVLGMCGNLKNWRGFLCGDPQLVNKLKKRFFLAGMNLGDIHADAFLPSAS